jgi:transposase InsO family protein
MALLSRVLVVRYEAAESQLQELGRLPLHLLPSIRQTLRSDNGPEFIARALRIWALTKQSEVATIEPGKPWQNGSAESFNATFRRECLDGEWFAHRREATILIEQWRREYNHERPHSSLGYRTPAEVGAESRSVSALRHDGVTQQTTHEILS